MSSNLFSDPAPHSRSASHVFRRLAFALLLASIISITYVASTAQAVPRPAHVRELLGTHWANLKSAYVPGYANQQVQMQEQGEERGGTRIRYQDGIAYAETLGRRHPMEALFEMGRRKAAEVQDKIDAVRRGGVAAAVDDYRVAFGMEPPEGFDVWYVACYLPRGLLPIWESLVTARHHGSGRC